MAGSTRAELASSSLDGSTFVASYPSGQRGTYSGSNLERSGSFRESLENRIMVSGPGTARNTALSMEIPPVSQYLTLEPISMSEQKYTRSGELRRVLGISVEEHSFGSVQSKPLPPIASEELKRFKASVVDSSNKARYDIPLTSVRAKFLQESVVKLDKYRNILSRKRQRSEPSGEKPSAANLLKMGGQAHQNPSEVASQRLEDRTKNAVPNKRVRTSMAEVRSEGRSAVPMRQGTTTDKDKSMLRACNGGPMPSEDKIRGLPPGGDVWEKKLKRKRSVGTMVNRIVEGERDFKQAIQQRPNNEPRSRSCDNLGFRPGSSSGIVGSNKIDGSSQISGANSRVIPKSDLDNSSLSNQRRERSAGLDKERIIAKGSNKLNAREDAPPGSQSPLTKGKASRAPRTSSAVVMNASSNFPRGSSGIDGWEQAPSLSKVQPLSGVTNRKRPMPTGSSSPPVTQWGGQRPQKISRTRRTNVVSPVSNFDEAQILPEGFAAPDAGARLATMESGGLLIARGISNNTLQPKLKPDNVASPAGLSESEESGAIENKFKEKGIDNGELEDGPLNTVHKATAFVLPKKNKVSLKEEIGDGVRRQGRSGRGSMQSKACLTLTKEKSENIDTTKPLKSGRPGSDKNESRVGRPPSKKASDRKSSTRPSLIITSGSSDLTGESDDDREELLSAANAARSASYNACSSPFWKKMEPNFAFVASEDITHVKNQINFAEELDESLSNMIDVDCNIMGELAFQAVLSPYSSFSIEQSQARENKSLGTLCSVDEPQHANTAFGKVETEKWLEKMVPLSQRLLSAFIEDEGTEKFDCDNEQGDMVLQFSSDYFSYDTNSNIENERKTDFMKSEFDMELDFKNRKNQSGDNIPCNGFMMSSNIRSSNIQNFISGDEVLAENNVMLHSDNGSLSEIGQTNSNLLQTMGASFSGTSLYECQFEHLSLDDRVLMELHSIGLYPESVPDLTEGEDCEIDRAISELKMGLYQQVRKKKNQLQKLDKAIQDVKEMEERSLEQLAMNKLVEMAYKRLMGGRGSHGSSHKSGVSKVSKQLALAFATRTIARCQKFEETGRSCFSEPAFSDVIISALPHSSDAKHVDGITSGTATSIYGESRSSQLGSRVSASGTLASVATSSMTERHGPSYKIDRGPLDSYQGLAHMSEQTIVKNDPISNRGKKKEVLLDDVVTSAASRATSNLSQSLPGGPKWKRTDRERDQNKDALMRNSTAKAGRPSLSSGRGERKTKTKPKQKTAQLSTSGNDLGRVTETANFMSPSGETTNSAGTNVDQEVELGSSGNVVQNSSKEMDDNIFTNLPLHGIDSIDELDVAEGLGGQGQDIASWLNVDEDALQDHDLVGLEIPMDDLSELRLNF